MYYFQSLKEIEKKKGIWFCQVCMLKRLKSKKSLYPKYCVGFSRYSETSLKQLIAKIGNKTKERSLSQQTNDSTEDTHAVKSDKKITDLSRKRLTASIPHDSQRSIQKVTIVLEKRTFSQAYSVKKDHFIELKTILKDLLLAIGDRASSAVQKKLVQAIKLARLLKSTYKAITFALKMEE